MTHTLFGVEVSNTQAGKQDLHGKAVAVRAVQLGFPGNDSLDAARLTLYPTKGDRLYHNN